MAGRRITIGDKETIVFYGDSITEQNLYAAYLETFLVSRFPEKHLKIYNFGWGGDTAPGGHSRFGRDVAPVKPTVVFVNFGMNDGSYTAPTPEIRDRYVNGQRALAAAIKAAGAREVLLTTSPADEPSGPNPYNDTLGKFADEVHALGRTLRIPVADIFRPMLAVSRAARAKDPKFAFCPPPDTIHPDAMGHLLMAWFVMRELKAPGPMAIEITAAGKAKTSGGAKVRGLKIEPGRIEFDLELPHLPFYVPPEARAALDLVPLQAELNGLFLKVAGWRRGVGCRMAVDGREVCILKPEALAAGADVALYDTAEWAEADRELWTIAQPRWRKHFEVWREMGFETRPAMLAFPGRRKMMAAQREFVAGLSEAMHALAQPRPYHVVLAEGSQVENFSRVEVSPLYPWDPAKDFEKPYPPEADPEKIQWSLGALENGMLDLAGHFGGPTNCVSYLRAVLQADQACRLHMDLGSDDGLTVWHNGRRLLARNVMRGCVIGDDRLDVELAQGRNMLLFRVTQGGGAYAFGIRAGVHGAAKVRQVL